jgi:hypothetical protein
MLLSNLQNTDNLVILPSGSGGTGNGRVGARPFEMIPRPTHKIPPVIGASIWLSGGRNNIKENTQQKNKNARQGDILQNLFISYGDEKNVQVRVNTTKHNIAISASEK